MYRSSGIVHEGPQGRQSPLVGSNAVQGDHKPRGITVSTFQVAFRFFINQDLVTTSSLAAGISNSSRIRAIRFRRYLCRNCKLCVRILLIVIGISIIDVICSRREQRRAAPACLPRQSSLHSRKGLGNGANLNY